MKKEVKILRGKAIDALVLSIELFNRPSEAGRAHGVLIFLDHAFEMLFKAIILHRGGRIREARAAQTIGFDASVRKGLSDAKVKFLTDHQALTVQMINSLRDAAQHHILDISEGHLYINAQAGSLPGHNRRRCECMPKVVKSHILQTGARESGLRFGHLTLRFVKNGAAPSPNTVRTSRHPVARRWYATPA
jgi:hypothetical protein